MMAAYQPQPGMHPVGMPSHGHPGMAPNPAQHMGQPMMQHPGVSGPGQPHVSQAGAMMGMQPGGANGGPMGAMAGGQHPGGGGMGMPGQPGQGMAGGGQSMAGGAPNAHAISHLTPQQSMQMHQLQMQANPQLAMAQHQQLLRQRQMQQAQAQANGMMAMQQGGMQSMTPQQMQHFQQTNPGVHPNAAGVQLTQNLQQQMQLRMQQQQAAQQSHQAQLQQQQQQQQQQQLAMQHANSQQSNQGQPGPPNQQNQPGHPVQMRPQSRMANPNEQNQTPQQQHPQQPQGQPQQHTPQPGQQPTPQQQQHQQQGQQSGMNAQQMMQHQQQMAMMQHQRQRQMQQQQLQQQHQQARAQAQAQAQQQQQQQHRPGAFILRINLFADHLSKFNLQNGKDMNEWNAFVEKHFAPEGRLLHTFDDNPNEKPKTFEVLRPTIARYFYTYFESGALSLRLHTEHASERPGRNGGYQVSYEFATLTVAYPTGARLEMTGCLNALFAPQSDTIECLEIQQTGTEEILSRAKVEEVLSTWAPVAAAETNNKSPKMTKTKLPKAQQKMQQQQQPLRLDGLTIDHFPRAPRGTRGVTSRVQQFLELGETMTVMSELMLFAQDKKLRPEQALEAWVSQNDGQGGNGGGGGANGQPQQQQQAMQQQQGNPQINLPPSINGGGGGVPGMGNRTPSMQNMQMPGQQPGNFSSPALSNLGLPMSQQQQQVQVNGLHHMNGGSPAHIPNNHPGLGVPPNMNMGMGMGGMPGGPNSHTPSPRQSNMAAPAMVPQHSQQGVGTGTNSSAGASANTSPNVNNKRRRSTVKLEGGGDEGAEVQQQQQQQQRVKPSPRMNKKAKPGG